MLTSTTKNEQLEHIKVHLFNQFHLSAEQINSMLPSFIVALRHHMENLEAAQSEGEITTIERASHTIKGALLNLGLTDCAKLALEIEQQSKTGADSKKIPEIIGQIRNLLNPLFD